MVNEIFNFENRTSDGENFRRSVEMTPPVYYFVLYHSVWFERDVRRIDFVVIFFQWTQNWTALNFEVNFQPLIQLNSRGLLISFDGGQPLLSRI